MRNRFVFRSGRRTLSRGEESRAEGFAREKVRVFVVFFCDSLPLSTIKSSIILIKAEKKKDNRRKLMAVKKIRENNKLEAISSLTSS